jgi:hypothetical protein
MHVGRRQLKSETDLAALYRRRESVVSLIRSLERYQRAPVCPTKAARARHSGPRPKVKPCRMNIEPVRFIAGV